MAPAAWYSESIVRFGTLPLAISSRDVPGTPLSRGSGFAPSAWICRKPGVVGALDWQQKPAVQRDAHRDVGHGESASSHELAAGEVAFRHLQIFRHLLA